MKNVIMHMSTHPRLLKDVLTQYKSTFAALKELINNAIQANAKRVKINLIPTDCDKDSINYHPIDVIKIHDDGNGVPFSQFDNKIMKVATDNKEGGLGIGRFGALQIGRTMSIYTVGYEIERKVYTTTSVVLATSMFQSNEELQELEIPCKTSETSNPLNTCYEVVISNLYQYEQTTKKKNKLSSEFESISNFKQALFESYPFNIFEGKINFVVNDEELTREQFCIGTPQYKSIAFADAQGKEHTINFHFYHVNLKEKNINIFFQIDNGGVMTSIAKYQYVSPWHTPDAGAWYIMIDSDIITHDMISNFELIDLGEQNAKAIQELIKEQIDNFFRETNIKYKSFIERLSKDPNYPYNSLKTDDRPSLEVNVFNHTAYLLEMEQKLIENNNSARKTIYPMVKRIIENGDTEFLVNKVVRLTDDSRRRFCELIDSTDLDDVISFSSSVAKHQQFLDFLHELCYGDISKWLKERSQLHKIIEKQLWIFGEEYNESTKLWSDKSLEKNLESLHKKYFSYEPTEEDENLIQEAQARDKDITDLFFYNKKKLGNGREEVLIVELKAPSCAIAEKEIQQIEKYRYDIISSPAYPHNKVCYKIILVSSRITPRAQVQIDAARSNKYEATPFLFSDYTKDGKDIKLYIMSWSELISENRKKLSYLSDSLSVKAEDANKKFDKEYPHLIDEKSRNRLNKRELN